MNLYTNDISIIKNEMNDLSQKILNSKKLYEALNYLALLNPLVKQYEIITGKKYKHIIPKKKKKRLDFYKRELIKREINNLTKQINENKDVLLNFCDCVLSCYDEVNLEKPEKSRARLFSEEELFEMIEDYLLTKQISTLPEFYNILDSKHLIVMKRNPVVGGLFLHSTLEQLPFIFAEKRKSLRGAFTIVHELGHMEEFGQFSRTISDKELFQYRVTNPFTETISSFYEKNSIDYSIQKDFDSPLSKNALYSFHKNSKNRVEGMKDSLSFLTDYLPDDFYNDFYDDLIYGIGGVLGSIINYKFEENPTEGRKLYYSFLYRRRQPIKNVLECFDIENDYPKVLQKDLGVINKKVTVQSRNEKKSTIIK